MRSARWRIVVGLVLTLPAAGRAETWTLDRAIAVALANSPDTRIAQARAAAAAALVTQADAAWYPQVSVSGGYLETTSPMRAFGSILNQQAFHFGLDFNQPGRIDNLNATGTIAYNLYSGGRASAGRSAARSGSEAATQDLKAAQHRLVAEVVKAALSVHKAREAVTAVAGGVRAYEAAVAAARARFDAGQLLESDLLSLDVQLAQTREQHASARHAAILAERGFRFVLGLEPAPEPLDIEGTHPLLDELSAPVSHDVSLRPELVAMEARVRAAESMLAIARGARRPAVNAFASHQYDRGWKLDRHGDSWSAGVALELNLFDGGQTRGKIAQARAELDAAREMLRKLSLAAAFEVEQARLAHEDALERLAVSARAVEQAEKSARLSRLRFEREALLAADLIGTESRLLDAKLRRTFAAAEERIALVELRRALGLEPVPGTQR